MKRLKLTLELRSALLTPFQSDTLFGHLCWAIRYGASEERLLKFLGQYAHAPPLLLTAAFPEGFLPQPVLPPLTYSETTQLARERYLDPKLGEKEPMRRMVEDLKRVRHHDLLALAQWKQVVRDLSPLALARAALDAAESRGIEETVTRTAVDRLTNSADKGQLFDHAETFYWRDGHPEKFNLWLNLDEQQVTAREVYDWFKIIEATGFGKRKSSGAGNVRVVTPFEEFARNDADLPADALDANAFVTLSSYVPRADDPVRGAYHLLIKRGKLGGEWATSANVWKKPLLMFAPGSLFLHNGEPRTHYGGLISDIHPNNPCIAQYAYAFPVGARVTQGVSA